jgi:hypothetical protein
MLALFPFSCPKEKGISIMSNRALGCWLLVCGFLFAAVVGCPTGPKRIHPPSINPSAAGAQAIQDFDTNKDGKISGDELDKCPGLKAAVDQVDTSGQKAPTAQMIAARIENWQKTKLGRMSLSCRVTRNGQPFSGAKVKFVPEKFLGENVKPAEGTTDQNGMAMISIPEISPPGIAPGFYRVEIEHPSIKVPDKYNTNTEFGQEVALDAKGIQEGIEFKMSF